MVYLRPEDRDALLVELPVRCGLCRANYVRNYCRTCDEMFVSCLCPVEKHEQSFTGFQHIGHRIYEGQRGEGPSTCCPQCGKRSYNLNDVRERYCGACHMFHDQMAIWGK
jgi:hypothetical protein